MTDEEERNAIIAEMKLAAENGDEEARDALDSYAYFHKCKEWINRAHDECENQATHWVFELMPSYSYKPACDSHKSCGSPWRPKDLPDPDFV